MNNNELKKFSRSELVDVLLEQAKEIEDLKAKLKEAESELESKKLKYANAGNLAEASIIVSGVLEAAQSAADIYLDNIRDSEDICKRMYDEAEAETKKMREDAEEQSKKILEDAEKSALQTKLAAKAEADGYWNEVSAKLENFYNEHAGLRDLLRFAEKPKSE